MFVRTGTYTASVKVFTRNTWDWLEIGLRKGDADYITRHCRGRRECVPTLRKRGKCWYLDFAFEEKIDLPDTEACGRRILAVDLGINSACTCCVMGPDGTVTGRSFLKLSGENDRLDRAIGRIKRAQQHGARRMPRLWAGAKGISRDIAVKTAGYIHTRQEAGVQEAAPPPLEGQVRTADGGSEGTPCEDPDLHGLCVEHEPPRL